MLLALSDVQVKSGVTCLYKVLLSGFSIGHPTFQHYRLKAVCEQQDAMRCWHAVQQWRAGSFGGS